VKLQIKALKPQKAPNEDFKALSGSVPPRAAPNRSGRLPNVQKKKLNLVHSFWRGGSKKKGTSPSAEAMYWIEYWDIYIYIYTYFFAPSLSWEFLAVSRDL
jgi:hypothetical protein